jgi:predicted NBD/HSP70 family sugar kinase
MEYFAGLDVSMEETRVCILDRDGTVIHEVKVPSTASDIEAALARLRGFAVEKLDFEIFWTAKYLIYKGRRLQFCQKRL